MTQLKVGLRVGDLDASCALYPQWSLARIRISGRPRSRSWLVMRVLRAAAGMAPTRPGTGRWSRRCGRGRSGPGRSRAARASAGISLRRLVADGEHVIDVPPRLSARTRIFCAGQGRKTDATDAHSVALAGTRMPGLAGHRVISSSRCCGSWPTGAGRWATTTPAWSPSCTSFCPGLIAGDAKKDLPAAQARKLLATVRPRDAAGRGRRRAVAELVSDLERTCQRKKAADRELSELLRATAITLTGRNGIGPPGAARLLIEAGDLTRFPSRMHFASWNGIAPIDASPGDQVRHRLPRAGSRQINRVLHIMAVAPAPLPRQRRPRLPRPESRRREDTRGSDAVPETPALRHRLPPDDPGFPRSKNGPGRTRGGGCWLQRGRLAPRRRHFGEVTSRTRQPRPYATQSLLPAVPGALSPAPDRSRCQALLA
jgi:hypothetical protein